MEQTGAPERVGIKIERPQKEEDVGFIYYLLMILALGLISITIWLLGLEFIGQPLPAVLRQAISL